MSTRSVHWAVEVASRVKSTDYPIGLDEARDRLSGIMVGDRPIEELLDHMRFPIDSPSELLKELKNQVAETVPNEEWSLAVVKALQGAQYPLDKEDARARLKGIVVDGKDLSTLVDKLCFPCIHPAQLLDQIAENLD